MMADRFRVHLAATLVALATLVTPSAAQPGAAKIPALGGVAGMKAWFNANRGHVRAVFLLSPT